MKRHDPTIPSGAGRQHSGRLAVLRPRELLAERYEIASLLGTGGMGAVYEARDRELGVQIALKILASDIHQDEEALRWFKREVLLARQVTHPNVCRLHDLGWDERRGLFFATMELLRGETLLDWREHAGPPTVEELLPIVRQMASGLDAAHAAGVTHRDIKATNVMLVEPAIAGPPRVVLTDFGLASPSRGEDLRTADSNEIVGTPAYMAPEQLLGEDVGPAADIYGLGVVLYEMVTGGLPFRGDDAWGGALNKLNEPPPSPRELRPDLPPSWERAILRCLAREPGDRFGAGHLLVSALEGRGDSAVREAGARGRLPAERDSFVGREADIDELFDRLRGGARLVSVIGLGGTGKTRLCLRLAHQKRASWPGGTWFCDLTDARSEEGIVSAVAATLDIPLGAGDPVEQLGHAIASHGSCLVLLDNFEQVARYAESTLGRWLDRAEEAQFLVTTREVLGLSGEVTFDLAPLSPADAEALFLERADVVRRGFRPTEEDREAISRLVRLLDLLPLAIEIAAARVATLTPHQILDRAGDRFRLLTTTSGRRNRQATLRATLDWSWELLEEDEKAALAQLSVFEGGFTVEAAEAVLELRDLWPVDAVQSLANKSLVIASAGNRFDLLVSVKEYAAERLRQRGETERIFERHGAWFAKCGSRQSIYLLDRKDGAEVRRRLVLELDNVVAACRRAVERGDAATAGSTFTAAWAVLRFRGPVLLAWELGAPILAMSGLETGAHCLCLRAVGAIQRLQGDLDGSIASHEQALAVARGAGNDREEGGTLLNLAGILMEAGRTEQAVRMFQESLEVLKSVDEPELLAGVYLNLGALALRQGRTREAQAQDEETLCIARKVGNLRLEGTVLGNLGVLHKTLGNRETARECLEQALSIYRQLEDRRAEGHILGNIGNMHQEEGRFAEARAHYARALEINRELGSRSWEATDLGNLGRLEIQEGRLEEAQRRFEESRAIHRELMDKAQEAPMLRSLAEVHLLRGRWEESRAALDEGETLLREGGFKVELARLLCQRGHLELAVGDLVAAHRALKESNALSEEMGMGTSSEVGLEVRELREAIQEADESG